MYRKGRTIEQLGALRVGERKPGRERVTLGVEMSLVFPTSHSKDPVDLVWVGRVEEDRLPWALRAKSRSQGGRDL